MNSGRFSHPLWPTGKLPIPLLPIAYKRAAAPSLPLPLATTGAPSVSPHLLTFSSLSTTPANSPLTVATPNHTTSPAISSPHPPPFTPTGIAAISSSPATLRFARRPPEAHPRQQPVKNIVILHLRQHLPVEPVPRRAYPRLPLPLARSSLSLVDSEDTTVFFLRQPLPPRRSAASLRCRSCWLHLIVLVLGRASSLAEDSWNTASDAVVPAKTKCRPSSPSSLQCQVHHHPPLR